MIAKHVPVARLKKGSFNRLVQYLTGSQDKAERVGDIRVTNCENADPQLAVLEVLNTQAQNTRAGADKTYHLIVSFRAHEHPDRATLQAIEERICDGLGFTGHQRVSVVHHDTDNVHVHIAINKIHPVRYTIHEPYLAYRTLGRLCDQLENELELAKDNHLARKSSAENRADDMERHADLESLIGWVQRTCKDQLREATSWAQLHTALAQHGLLLQVRTNGFVIAADNGTTIKASSVGREFSRQKLEQRLGPYQAAVPGIRTDKVADAPAVTGRFDASPKPYVEAPLASRFDTSVLYARYKALQATSHALRATEWERARAHKQRMIEAVKEHVRIQRSILRLAKLPRAAKKLTYALANRSLRSEIERIHQRYLNQRREIYRKHRPRQWADWLRDEAQAGSNEALAALRSRTPRGAPALEGVSGPTVRQAAVLRNHDSVTKKGAIIYRVGTSAVRDDGNQLRVSRGADRSTLLAALRMASARFGQRLNVAGAERFREELVQAAVVADMKITFVDAALEQRRQQLTDARRALGRGAAVPAPDVRAALSQAQAHAAAVDRYINEREQTRTIASDIPKHVRYTALNAGTAEYAGYRQVNGQILALLKRGDDVMVLAIDDATAKRLKRLRLGVQVSVNPQGVIRKKGRSR